jgi:putative Mg2+ transporter-C (MgtC) family protein
VSELSGSWQRFIGSVAIRALLMNQWEVVFEALGGHRTELPTLEAILRTFIAVVVGSLIGLDRELRNKPAGLRTHILISLAAALFTLITFELHAQFSDGDKAADPVRIIEAVTAGVAFLAAGAIIQSRGNVQGLTTGANMWLAGALGVACGAGYYFIALIGTVFALLVLVVLAKVQARILAKTPSDDRDGDDDPGGSDSPRSRAPK